MSALVLDLRLALRSIRARPGFALAVVLCIGLGSGVNTTAYSMLHAIVLMPLPYANPDALAAVAMFAIWLPARRVLHIDPPIALRSE